ncbi:MAG: TIGR03936 family radical SAM-associated protein [Anaerolineales bacterium]|jgi:radical SAM-linked protein
MTNIERYRYRIQFEKTRLIRFISHLDLHRAWERTLRRAELPVYHSQGYNPRPKINLSRALPLGQTSECELLDVWLEEELEPIILLGRLKDAAPPGLILTGIEQVPLSEKSLQSRIHTAIYQVTIPHLDVDQLKKDIEGMMQADHIQRVRREKPYDLRPLIEEISIESSTDEDVTLEMRLSAREGASGRPEEILLELGLQPEQAHIHRKALFFNP